MKVLAMFSVYKKSKERALTVSTSKNSIIKTWINLPSPPLLVLQAVSSLSRIAISLMAVLYKLTLMQSQLDCFVGLTTKLFLLQTFMVLPTLYRNRDLLHGS